MEKLGVLQKQYYTDRREVAAVQSVTSLICLLPLMFATDADELVRVIYMLQKNWFVQSFCLTLGLICILVCVILFSTIGSSGHRLYEEDRDSVTKFLKLNTRAKNAPVHKQKQWKR